MTVAWITEQWDTHRIQRVPKCCACFRQTYPSLASIRSHFLNSPPSPPLPPLFFGPLILVFTTSYPRYQDASAADSIVLPKVCLSAVVPVPVPFLNVIHFGLWDRIASDN